MVEKSKSAVLLSGMMRSGTTFLQRLLDIHPGTTFKYQETTAFFINEKKSFLQSIGNNDYHVLSHYSSPDHYALSEFTKWLECQSDPFETRLESLLLEDQGNQIYGVKEVLVEEFFPYFVNHDIKCINIIRDPRDVIASMSFGRGTRFAGKPRPVLFDIRNWKKSLHIARALNGHRNFHWVKFEELILSNDEVLKALFSWLEIEQLSSREIINLMQVDPGVWTGNSSFGPRKLFDPQSIGIYKTALPVDVKNYVEAVAYNEIKEAGYPVEERSNEERINIIRSYKDHFKIERNEFSQDYSSCKMNIEFEIDHLSQSKLHFL